ncbi:hypothetical protein V1507DRAFT_89187, partial [Lipomyces tetrasporus]
MCRGGSVLAQLLSSTHSSIRELNITAIVRRQEQADILAKNGINAELFNGLDDTEQLRRIASKYDIVLHCATGRHTFAAEALVLGLGDGMKKNGQQAYYIHTTGTSNLAYSIVSNPNAALRDFSDADDDIYEEELRRDAEQLYLQRRTDLVVLETAEKTGVKPYLMMPPTIYGRGLGLFKTQSIQIPFTIRHTINAGYPEYIGDGSGTVGYVHIADLAVLYELLLSKILEGADIPYGRKGYYFSNTSAFTWKDLNEKLGVIGYRSGALKSPTPVSITLEEAAERWGFIEGNQLLLETNHAGRSKTTPKRAYELGWVPEKTAADWDTE